SASAAPARDGDIVDTLSRFIGAGNEAVQQFGAAGETLVHIGGGTFAGAGTGSVKRGLARRWDAALEPWRQASRTTRDSLPYRLAPHALLVSDIATSLVAPALEGDMRGAVGNAVNMAVSPAVTGAGVSLFGAIGSGAGAAVGSFIPVVGTAAGAMVGGAIGTVAGGFIASFAYDKYVKELVGKGVEAGIAGVFDTDPLRQAMLARDAFLRGQAQGELRQAWEGLRMVSQDFDPGQSVELVGPGTTPYIVVPREPETTLPEPGAAGDLLAGVKTFVLNQNSEMNHPVVCTIDDGQVSCSLPPAGIGPAVRQLYQSLSGVVAGNTLDLEFRAGFESDGNDCTNTTVYRGSNQVVLEEGGRTLATSTVTMTSSGCGEPMATSDSYSDVVGTWHAVQ
ncbi:MAG: hypothetical protein Q8L54_02810, partial [Devosia sp.]|nr:hypothetical protein [Devosia sp.]